jgi:ubiquinone/menaquinone biosynthesis C-methylase UbiE
VERTLARLEPRSDARILDVGSGTGFLLERLAREHPPELLAGADLSGGMLGVARRRLPPGVALVQADAAALPFPSGAFGEVVSSSAFHFWRRPVEGLREIRRVLEPGGTLTLTDWSRDFLGPRFRELWLRALDPAHFRTWRRSEVTEMLEEAGFRVLEAELYRIRPTWGMMTFRAARPGPGPSPAPPGPLP